MTDIEIQAFAIVFDKLLELRSRNPAPDVSTSMRLLASTLADAGGLPALSAVLDAVVAMRPEQADWIEGTLDRVFSGLAGWGS